MRALLFAAALMPAFPALAQTTSRETANAVAGRATMDSLNLGGPGPRARRSD